MTAILQYRFRVRRRTAAEWTSLNEVLLDSEFGRETDTNKFKIGDGTTAWNDLDYIIDPSASGDGENAVTALAIASGVVNVDCSLGDYFKLSLNANVTSITFSNLPASGKGQSIMIRMQQDGTGSRTVALPASFKAIAGSDTAVQATANAYTIIAATTFDQGTRWEYVMRAGA